MDRVTWEALVERYEVEAEAAPAAYQRKVVAFTALAFGVLVASTLVGGAVLLALLAVVFVAGKAIVLVKGWKALVVVGAFLWATIRALFVRFPPLRGHRLMRADHPALFERLEAIRTAADAKPVDRVLLTADFNAGVATTPIFGLFPFYRRTLLLGMPLMLALSPEELDAVLAHEMGHLSKSHSKKAQWVYRVRGMWARFMGMYAEKGEAPPGLLGKFLGWYIPRFEALSFALARKNEYEADAIAAQVAGADLAGQALVRVKAAARWLDRGFWRDVFAEAATRIEAPSDVYRRMAREAAALRVDADEVTRAMRRPTDHADTHPSLQDRLAALGVEATPPPPFERSAAAALFGEGLEPLLAQMDAEFAPFLEQEWAAEREALLAAMQQLAELEATPASEAGDPERAFKHAMLVGQVRGDAAGMAALRAFVEREPDHAHACYLLGRGLIDEDDPAGVPHLERAARLDPGLQLPVSALLSGFHFERGEREVADRHRDRADAAADALDAADLDRNQVTPKDELLPVTDEAIREVLDDATAVVRSIKAGWVVEKRLTTPGPGPLYVVMVKLGYNLLGEKEEQRPELLDRVWETLPEGPLWIVLAEDQAGAVGRRIKKVPNAKVV